MQAEAFSIGAGVSAEAPLWPQGHQDHKPESSTLYPSTHQEAQPEPRVCLTKNAPYQELKVPPVSLVLFLQTFTYH